MEMQFHKLNDGPPKADVISEKELKEFTSLGVTILFDVETDIGGFRFIHAHNDKIETKYLIMFYSGFSDRPTIFELPLPQFHQYVSFWIVQGHVDEGELKMPEGKPTPMDNLCYCLISIVQNSVMHTPDDNEIDWERFEGDAE